MNMNDHYPFFKAPLPYANDALEPFIDEKTMELHHDRRLQAPVRHNAGGVYNHRFYFEGLAGAGSQDHAPALFHEITRQFGSIRNFRRLFKEAALSVFGSGYAWLIFENGCLKITTSADQDTPDLNKVTPLLNIDVWEHAYYLKHYNMRSAYIDDWFRVINWECLERRFRSCFSPRRYFR